MSGLSCMSPNTSTAKQHRQQIRTSKRDLRNNLTKSQQHLHAQKVCRLLQKNPEFVRAKNIAFYLASDGEIDLSLLICFAQKIGKQCFLPCIEKKSATKLFTFNIHSKKSEKKSMVFRRYRRQTQLIKNTFGIQEPHPNTPSIISSKIDLVIMPLVSFDKQGNRLGMGGGFYDREFSAKHHLPHTQPSLIGVAHHCQGSEHIPHLHWDVPLKCIITEMEKVQPRR